MHGIDDRCRDSEELKRVLLFGELLKQVLVPSAPKHPARPWWQVVIESSGGAALITVIIGGIVAGTVGQYLTYRYQQSLRQREVAAVTYETYLKRSDETITRSFAFIGDVMSASDDLMRVAAWNPQLYPASARPEIVARRDKYVETYRSAMTAWEKERDRQALLLRYYHNANPAVGDTWRTLQASVSAYAHCTTQYYWRNAVSEVKTPWAEVDFCVGERQIVFNTIDRFTVARLDAARDQAARSVQAN
jgi:hypothetical protein